MANKSTSTRVSNPPGGVSSNIFTTPESDTPRKVRNHQKSSIFGADESDCVKRNISSPRNQLDTKQRLFGEVDSGASPRRVTDTWRSNVVFSASSDCLSDEVKRTPKRSPSAGINPITGELLLNSQEENGASPPYTNGVKNGESEENGHHNGHHGENGHKGENGIKNGDVIEKKMVNGRQPPGGKSSGIFG